MTSPLDIAVYPKQFKRHVRDWVSHVTSMIGAFPFLSGRCARPPSGAATLLHNRTVTEANASDKVGAKDPRLVTGRCSEPSRTPRLSMHSSTRSRSVDMSIARRNRPLCSLPRCPGRLLTVWETQLTEEMAMADAATLHDAFVDELRDVYDAEKQLTKALPKIAEAADLLQQTLGEEKAADRKLSSLAEGGINQEAADAAHPGEDEDASEPPPAARQKQSSAVGGKRLSRR